MIMVLLRVDCTRLVQILQGLTSVHALEVSTPTIIARILTSVLKLVATRMLFVVTLKGAFLVLARRVMKEMATRNALTVMNAKLLLIRYCTPVVSFVTIRSSSGGISTNLMEHLTPVKKTERSQQCSNLQFYAQVVLSRAGLF